MSEKVIMFALIWILYIMGEERSEGGYFYPTIVLISALICTLIENFI